MSPQEKSNLLNTIKEQEKAIIELCNAQLKSIAFGCSYDINVDKQINDLTEQMLRNTETLNNNSFTGNDWKASDVVI